MGNHVAVHEDCKLAWDNSGKKASSMGTRTTYLMILVSTVRHPRFQAKHTLTTLFAPGDDSLRTSLTKRARSFDPSTYWSTHNLRLFTIAVTASTKPANPPPTTSTSLHNPYADLLCGRQLSETVSAFLTRLPPSVTTSASIGSPWIFIANPHAPNRATSEDWAGFTARGTELLDALSAARADLEASMPGKAKATITRKVTPLRKQLEKDLLAAAKERECTTGKWMLFPTVEDVDYVWGKVAKGTAERELGIAAKVAAMEDGGEGDGGARRLICVYTKDFADAEDVKRVLLGLKGQGLLRGDDGGEGRGIYYKCGECARSRHASWCRVVCEKYVC